MEFEQFVPSEVCLKCDGCCRFKEPGTIWRPKLTQEEAAIVKTSGLAQKIFSTDTLDQNQFIRTKPGCGEHLCQFFNPEDHTCAIYQARPFECELYPYVVSRGENDTALYVHRNCPHVEANYQKPHMTQYNRYLRDFFNRPDVRGFLKRNREFLNDYSAYHNELEFVFLLEGI